MWVQKIRCVTPLLPAEGAAEKSRIWKFDWLQADGGASLLEHAMSSTAYQWPNPLCWTISAGRIEKIQWTSKIFLSLLVIKLSPLSVDCWALEVCAAIREPNSIFGQPVNRPLLEGRSCQKSPRYYYLETAQMVASTQYCTAEPHVKVGRVMSQTGRDLVWDIPLRILRRGSASKNESTCIVIQDKGGKMSP